VFCPQGRAGGREQPAPRVSFHAAIHLSLDFCFSMFDWLLRPTPPFVIHYRFHFTHLQTRASIARKSLSGLRKPVIASKDASRDAP
jgi:hypothetical protein